MTIDALRSLENEAWPVRDANEDAELLDTSSPLPTPVQEDCMTLRDLAKMLQTVLTVQQNHMVSQEVQMRNLLGDMIDLSAKVDHLIEALAEDQDPDELPATYLDGSRV